MPTDEQLARQAVDGDEAAFGELIRRHQKTVYRLAMRMLGNSEDADDVTQESFVRAFRYLRSFRVDRRFGAWLMGIAIRQCADFARDRRLRRETSLDEARNSVSGVTPSSAFDTRDLRGLLSRVIQHLPSRQRAVFILFAHEGRTLDEIAETLNCSVGTVKTHLHRARQRLRRELQHVIKGGETDDLSTGTTRAERTARRACPSTL